MKFLIFLLLPTLVNASNLIQFFPSSGGSGAVSGEAFITSGTSWTVPAGVTRVDVILVGGGNGGRLGTGNYIAGGDVKGGYGGSSGRVFVIYNMSVTAGASIPVEVGSGGAYSVDGTESCFNSVCSTSGALNGGGEGGFIRANGSSVAGSSGGDCTTCTVSIPSTSGAYVTYPVHTGGGGGGSSSAGPPRVGNGGGGGRGFRFDLFRSVTSSTTEYGTGGSGQRLRINTDGTAGSSTNGTAGTAGAIYVRW